MGRVIDADRLKEVFSRNVVGGNAYFDLIDNAPTVEAISKADYKKRLRVDLKTILEELQREIDDIVKQEEPIDNKWSTGLHYSEKIIQEKIDKIKEEMKKDEKK